MTFGQDEVRIQIVADDKTRRGTDSAKRNMGQLDGSLGTIKKNWLAVGAAAGVATVAIGGAVRVAAGMISAASDMAESQSKVNVVFGESADAINRWAEDASTAMGISREEALASAGTFGNLFTAMGLTQQAAAPLSQSVVQLAVDLGSFNNIANDEALLKLRAGLVGEVEPLRALGINLSAVTVEMKAMELGLIRTKSELTEQIKIQSRWALIQEQSTNAAGDFERTSDGLANQLKTLNAQWDDMKVSLGELLLGPVTTGVTKFNDLLTALNGIKDLGVIKVTMEVLVKEVPGESGLTFGQLLKISAGIADPFGQIGTAIGLGGQAIGSLGAQGISTIGAVLPGFNIPRRQPDESALFAERPFQGADSPGVSAVTALVDLWKEADNAADATKRANVQIDLLHDRLDDASKSSAALSAAENARASIVADQTTQIVEAFLQGGEDAVSVVREEQHALDAAWVDVAAGLQDLGVIVPDEFRGMWESMLEIEKDKQAELLKQSMDHARQLTEANRAILTGEGSLADFVLRQQPGLGAAGASEFVATQQGLSTFLEMLLAGDLQDVDLAEVLSAFQQNGLDVVNALIQNGQLMIDALGNLRPVFIVQIGDQPFEDAVVTATENAETNGRRTASLP